MVGFRSEKDISVGGSGGTYVKGFVDANYRNDFTLQEAKDFIEKAITLAAYQDSSSGGCIRMINITKEAVTREFIPYTDFKKK
jgi:20S proteasome subunit beta 1